MKSKTTGRGFAISEFRDSYDNACSLQKSSAAMEDKVWLGITDPGGTACIMARDAERMGLTHLLAPPHDPERFNGWVKYPIPKEVNIWGRMHLTREQVAELLPALEHFVKTGDLP